ncbi:MAG: 30S ribosomal protein S8 [Hirschia sp.]|nr:30S ribosomal protein S8 [Hirschia sp.]MBF19871.1 30S ribosomal protein S8 [Hirschia sp.]|tara:strand:- start:807 stop:1202 length:396 start_codon:yes stop_codon:yes gene_type:complete
MNLNDPLGDMLTRIRNAQQRGRSTVATPASKLRARVLDVLQSEGYIRGYTEVEKDGKHEIEIELKYYDGAPVISEVRRISKPGRRVYSGSKDIPLVRNGLGISILSTPKGVMSDNVARESNVGGEILCRVS